MGKKRTPIHSLLVIVPMGLLLTSLIFDVLFLMSQRPQWAEFSFWMIAAGVISAFIVSFFGLIDWLTIPPLSPTKSLGLWHGIGTLMVTLLFGTSWILRMDIPTTLDAIPFVLSCAGVCLALTTAWFGGELADRLGYHSEMPSAIPSENAAVLQERRV